MSNVYINSIGVYLPNDPILNEEIEDYLGLINGKKSLLKDKILSQNGIKTRFFALDKNQETTHSNAFMAAEAVKNAIAKTKYLQEDIQLLATGTTQGDLPVPGFASMVHSKLEFKKCDLASFQSVCASGMMALKNSYLGIKSDEVSKAVAVGSEFASRMFKASRFEKQQIDSLPFDAEFLSVVNDFICKYKKRN